MKIDIVKTERADFEKAIKELNKEELEAVILGLKGELEKDYESFTFEVNDIPFDRIRRITGYLVGTVDRFNNGKKAEEHDRVKHSL